MESVDDDIQQARQIQLTLMRNLGSCGTTGSPVGLPVFKPHIIALLLIQHFLRQDNRLPRPLLAASPPCVDTTPIPAPPYFKQKAFWTHISRPQVSIWA